MKKFLFLSITLTIFFFPNAKPLLWDDVCNHCEPLYDYDDVKEAFSYNINKALNNTKKRNYNLINNIKTYPDSIKVFKQYLEIQDRINKNRRYPNTKYRYMTTPLDIKSIAEIFSFMINIISEITSLTEEARTIIKNNIKWMAFTSLLGKYFSVTMFKFIKENIDIDYNDLQSSKNVTNDGFQGIKNILKQKQNEDTNRLIDHLFTANNAIVKNAMQEFLKAKNAPYVEHRTKEEMETTKITIKNDIEKAMQMSILAI